MNLVQNIFSSITFNGNFCVLGIDGPTASGKTTLANNIRDLFMQMKIPALIYQLDWCLIEREQRLKEVDDILSKKQAFEYEADKHMNIERATTFLNFVEKYRYVDFDNISIKLEGLYNREDDGKCTGIAEMSLEKGMVIIVEGHYTHHRLLRRYFDLNYLLIAKEDVLLKRKVSRVGYYREESVANDYFKWIDMPSFWHYFLKNICFFKNIYQNDLFENQKLLVVKQVPNGLFKDNPKTDYYVCNCFDSITSKLFCIVKTNHNQFIQLWGIALQYRKVGLGECLNKSFVNTDYCLLYSVFDLDNSNAFSYHYGLKIEDKRILVIGNLQHIKIVITDTLNKRMYGLICDSNGLSRDANFTNFSPFDYSKPKAYVIAPNRFLIPSFLVENEFFKFCFYDNEESVWNLAKEIVFNASLYILRLKNKQQREFTIEFLELLEYEVVKIGSYLFAEKLSDKKMIDLLRGFVDDYRAFDFNDNFDNLSIEEVEQLEQNGCRLVDNKFSFNKNTNFKELSRFYERVSSKTKIKLTESVKGFFPDMEFASNVNLSSYISSLPLSLKEFYLALSISQKGAVPFLSIYDIHPQSVDIISYFDFFSTRKLPFGIQASLNALGTKAKSGYLNLDGPEIMAKAVKENLLKFLRENPTKKLPLWNLGIDHASFKNGHFDDAFTIIKEAVQSQWIMSFCIDLSELLRVDLKNIQSKTINKLLLRLFSENLQKEFDLEFYIGNEKVFNKVSDKKALEIYSKFSKLFYEKAKSLGFEINFLLGPSLGTRHHQAHVQINPEKSHEISKISLQYGFVGNVLHGTSYTPFSSITNLQNYNCIRINYAGKLLFAIAKGLPLGKLHSMGLEQNELKLKICNLDRKTIESSKDDIKKQLFIQLDEIERSGFDSPLTQIEIEWFRKNNAILSDDDFEIVCQKAEKNQKSLNIKSQRAVYLASMIEVPFNDFSNGLVSKIIQHGINHFHIDIADGKYISRTIDGIEKLNYIGTYFPNVQTHLHLMVTNPFAENNGLSLVNQLCSIKKSIVYIHTESYNCADSWEDGAQQILGLGSIPGLVLKVDETLELSVFLEKMRQVQIHHLLIMGVPIGRGGQMFRNETIEKIKKVKDWSEINSYNISIEVDGGLSDEVIPKCINAGAEFLAGWSFFLKFGIENIEKRIEELLNG
ncbi:MAG: hypothetical protein PHY85_00545 [Bacteroidales bacterium]|nr:hypothetical protein [Bacteroidales bacterium]